MDSVETGKIKKSLEEYGLVEKYSYGVSSSTLDLCRIVLRLRPGLYRPQGEKWVCLQGPVKYWLRRSGLN